MKEWAHITKSILPSSRTHSRTAPSNDSSFLTSIFPMPITLDPTRISAIAWATRAVVSAFLPTMHAFAPSWTSALTWAEQIVRTAAASTKDYPTIYCGWEWIQVFGGFIAYRKYCCAILGNGIRLTKATSLSLVNGVLGGCLQMSITERLVL